MGVNVSPEHKSMLCVGGPRSGQRCHVLHGAGFCVPVKMPDASEDTDPSSEQYRPNRSVKVEFTNYRSEVFHTLQGDVSFWVPEGQTQLETITLLLDTYERAAGKRGE